MQSGTNIVDHIFAHCDDSALALIHGDRAVTYGELRALMDEVSGRLRETGWFEPQQDKAVKVGVSIPNGIAHILYSLAVLRCGGCLAPIPGELTNRERDALVDRIGLDLVIAGEGQAWHRDAEASVDVGVSGMELVLHKETTSAAALDYAEKDLAALNPALIRFSSGTTGQSKGVVLSHDTLWDRVTACNSRLKIGPEDRVIWSLPMAHHFAVSIVLYLSHGATTVLADNNLAEDIYGAVTRFQGTVLYGSPFHYSLLADYPEGAPMPSVRLAVSTAAPLSEEVAEAFRDRYGMPLTQGLGVIEVGLPLLNDDCAADDPLAIGLPQDGFEVRVRSEDGRSCAPGEVGELLLRGPGMFDAYLSPWRTREDATAEGWFETGDLGVLSESGVVTWKGRLKSVINVAGMKVFAEEVEEVLCRHPEVQEARASGTPHPYMGQAVTAEIVPNDPGAPPKPAGLKSFCREHLAPYKTPMMIRFVESLPRTSSGKVRRD